MSRLPPPPLHPSISSKLQAKGLTPERRLPPPVHPASSRSEFGKGSPSPAIGDDPMIYSDPPTPSIDETGDSSGSRADPPPIPPRKPAENALEAIEHEDPPTPSVDTTESREPPLHPASLISRFKTPVEDAELPEGSSIPGALVLDVDSTTVLTAVQEDAIRQQLEDNEINWYLESFGKHVQHLRVATKTSPDASIAPLQKPKLEDYTFEAVARRMKVIKDEQIEDVEGSETASLNSRLEVDDEPEVGKSEDSRVESVAWADVDLWAYAAAYARYLLGPPTPSQPHEPFSIPRLKSNAERLYVVAVPAWQMIMSEIGELCLWKSNSRTVFAITFYAAQIITSTFLSTSCILILYKLLKTRFFPPSPLSLYKAALEARQRLQEAEALTDEVTGYDQAEDMPSSSSSGSLGIGIDLSKAKKGLGIAGEAIELEGKDGKGKKQKRKMMKKLKELEAELGPGAVVVLGDIADVHEKVKNLFMWRSPTASTHFAILLAVSAVLSHLTPIWILVKLVQVALGVVAFVVVPMIAAQERYEPSAWLIGGAPTDSEYAMHLIRKRAAAGKPIVHDKRISKPSRKMSANPSILSSITDPSVSEVVLVDPAESTMAAASTKKGFSWEKVLAVGERGSQLLESSRQYATGEKGVELKLAKPGESSGILTQMKLGSGGPGLILTRKEGAASGGQASDSVSYLAQYRARPGSLSISTTCIQFKPLIASKDASTKSEGDAPDKLVKEKEITIPMEDIVGIKKRDKTTFLVVVSAGLEIECKDGRSVRFAFVANRDQAFNRLVASSHQAFAKV